MTHTIYAHRIMFMDVYTICASAAAGNKAQRVNRRQASDSSITLSFSLRLTLRAHQADAKGGGTDTEGRFGASTQEQETSNTCMHIHIRFIDWSL